MDTNFKKNHERSIFVFNQVFFERIKFHIKIFLYLYLFITQYSYIYLLKGVLYYLVIVIGPFYEIRERIDDVKGTPIVYKIDDCGT